MIKIDLNNYEGFLLDYLEGNLNETDLNQLKTFSLLHPELNIDLGKNELPYFSKEDLNSDFKSDLLKSERNLPDEKLIAYVEGKLSDLEKEKLEKELKSDKTLAEELKLYNASILHVDKSIVFDAKSLLMKNEDELLLNNSALLYVEGLLSENEKLAFEIAVKNNLTFKYELELFKKTKLLFDNAEIHPDKESLKKEGKVIVWFNTRAIVSIAAALLLIIGLSIVFNNLDTDSTIKKEISTKSNVLQKNENKKQLSLDSIKPTENIEQLVPEKNYVSSNNSPKKIVLKIKNDTVNVIEKNNENKNIVIEEKPYKEIVSPPIIKNDTVIVSNKAKALEKIGNNSNQTKQTTLLAYDEDDEAIVLDENQKKPGFWKRAAKLAKQANGLGVKAVNGEERSGDRFMLSFNAFSIEKK